MNAPKLRFKEFNDEWSQMKIKEVANVIGGGTPSTDELKYWGNEINWFTPSEIGKTKYVSSSQRKITISGLNNSSAKLLPEGTILLSSRATVGEASILLREASTNQGFQSLVVNKKHNNEFIYYLKEKYKKEMLIKAFGSTFLEISKSNVENIDIIIPTLKEQTKIANFLSLLDKKIELQTKKIEDLKLFKLCISNEFFNENIKERKSPLSNYCKLSTAKSKVNKINSNGCYYIMDMGTITPDGYILKSKPTFCNEDIIKEGELVMPKDDIGGGLIIGRTGYINENKKYILGDHVYLLKTENINSLFLHYQINSQYINRQLKKKVTGSAQLGLKASNIINQDIFIYSSEMQNKISKILCLCDTKILNEIKKTERLMELKKGLMQNMFV